MLVRVLELTVSAKPVRENPLVSEEPVQNWKDDLRTFLEVLRVQASGQTREEHSRQLEETLTQEVYPAFEEFLSEMTRHGVGGQIFGRGTAYGVTLRLDDGFEVAVERDRYREQAHLLPRLIFIRYVDVNGRRCLNTEGVAWDRARKADCIDRVLMEYKHWRLLSLLAGPPALPPAP